ncbi:MAG TPA: ABC transporter ATP-binding protein [Candidatus Brocadiia bacterium]|nr:ABC transporter ATP-binding protein [Candidatus Brocadiales bacterium]
MNHLLEVKNLSVYYGTVRALEDASFYVDSNEIVAMVGPNGAGKSTALKAVTGLIQPKSGEIKFNGANIKGLNTDVLVNKGLCLVPEGRRLFPSMTVIENLEMGAFIRTDKQGVKEDIDKMFHLFPILKERLYQKAGTLSGGEQQMLAIGRALMLKPSLLLLDEPSLGLSPNFVEAVFEKLIEINKNGTSILVVEQNAKKALDICHRGYVFNIGTIVLQGKKEELIKEERIKQVYLGG